MPHRPNVLLICTDHWAGSHLGIEGHLSLLTPTLDQLARNGVLFSQAYSECPVCIPARRTLMTGTTPRTHGDRVYTDRMLMPDVPTLAQTFRDAGYQAYASGKMHVYPQRNRIGFDDVMLGEEGRVQFGVVDDYELFLGDQGYAGQQFAHGMCNNEYLWRPWHLPEYCHVTNWTTREMVRFIKRRDPTRPSLWYLSYCHPHPPLAPLQAYLEIYRDVEIDMPFAGEWAQNEATLPPALREFREQWSRLSEAEIRGARRAFYALCTHIDHQIRVVIGAIREEGLLDNTIIMFTSDHGDLLGTHGLWQKRWFYEDSARVPMILLGTAGDERVGHHRVDNRLVGLQDVMPTLLDLAGLPIPDTVEGISMVGEQRRDYLFGEISNGARATRMVRDRRYKLIYYPLGNVTQLFDMENDPKELHDLSQSPEHQDIKERLTAALIQELHDGDEAWVQEGKLVGVPARPFAPGPNRGLSGQRGLHWPIAPSVGEFEDVGR
ncbi:MAG: sulfatase-like hydrolase/transferase [Anaerolineae bacterium]|nr:sulfatase-like hydrolase/transferase [Anaerolineae bacterium]